MGRFWPFVEFGLHPQGAARPTPVAFHHWPGLDLDQLFANPLYAKVFARLGLGRQDVFLIDRPMSFGTLVVPDTASTYHENLDRRMARLFAALTGDVPPRHPAPHAEGRRRVVYLSRSRWPDNRRVLNEAELDAALAAQGIEIAHTETLAPDALLAMLRDADTIVATDGSHAHLAAFCRPGTHAVMLDTRPVPTQIAIEKLLGLHALHVPLFETHLYLDLRIMDVAALAAVVTRAVAHLEASRQV